MTDGNTHAINQHLNYREDWDALQEVTVELEQAEARIEELELAVRYEADLAQMALDARKELEAKLAKVMEALQSMPEAVVHTTLDDGPLWPEDRIGVWLAALHACKNVVQSKVDQTLAELKGQDDE